MLEENVTTAVDTVLEPVKRLRKDIKKVLTPELLGTREIRFMVDSYYQRQRSRIAAGLQIGQMTKSGEPHEVLEWLGQQDDVLEQQIKSALDKWTSIHPVGVWCKSICGIGPVIAAGLLANIDVERANTAGKVWAYAGLNPDMVWEKGQKRPFNMRLKTLCAYKLGESFVKVHNNKNDVYGKIYADRKVKEQAKNENLEFKALADEALTRFKKGTEAYEWYLKGMLPPGRIHARARRYAVKLFLSHYHMVAFFEHFKVLPPNPYVVEHLFHADIILPPNAHLIDGLPPALQQLKRNIVLHTSGQTPREYVKKPKVAKATVASEGTDSNQ